MVSSNPATRLDFSSTFSQSVELKIKKASKKVVLVAITLQVMAFKMLIFRDWVFIALFNFKIILTHTTLLTKIRFYIFK